MTANSPMITNDEWYPLLVGMSATLAGIGLARFAFSALIPALVEAQWFTDDQAAYLGAANLLGYLAGALLAHRLAERYRTRSLVLLSFGTIAVSFLACAQPAHFGWFFVWRWGAGVAGALLMILGPSTALLLLPPARRAQLGPLLLSASVSEPCCRHCWFPGCYRVT